MLLKELQLKNIRSYVDEKISFPEGSTLLSGDIGCGKSSILLAIEFALFGASRSDLPAELLLRKGAVQGSAELSFVVKNQEITIGRNIKRDKNGIKQLSGHLVLNGVKKELTAVELKAEMLRILGYPEELLSKNKNYIFRYTVYTPQEEMKLILQENEEVRLDVLRKIFSVDKYKMIRENTQSFLKVMRAKIATLKTRLEPLEETKNKEAEIKGEKERLQIELEKVRPEVERVQKAKEEVQQEIERLEKEQRIFLEFQEKGKITKMLLAEKAQQVEQLLLKKRGLQEQIKDSFSEEAFTKIEKEVQELEQKQRLFVEEKSRLDTRVVHIRKVIEDLQQEIVKIQEELGLRQEKEKELEQITGKIREKEALEKKEKSLQELTEKINESVTKNQTILEQAKSLRDKLQGLEECPTCLQEVQVDHKQHITSQEKEKIIKAEELLFEFSKRKSQIVSQQQEVKVKLHEIVQLQNKYTRLKVELEKYSEKEELFQQKKEMLKEYAQQNNQYMRRLQEMKAENVDEIQTLIKEKRILLQGLQQQKLVFTQLQEVQTQITQGQDKIGELEIQREKTEALLMQKKDLTVRIQEEKQRLEQIRSREQQYLVQQAEFETSLKGVMKQQEEVKVMLDKLQEFQNSLVSLQEKYHWLDAYFVKLTYTIEKHVMVGIHQLFNQLFQEWFSILIDDDTITARIDDSFSPVIEQNGYEVSFSTLSGGEKTSCSLAYRLALNRVINDVIHMINTKNVLILDEPTDGFSTEQLDKVRDVLDKLGLQQTLIVSHENKIESFVDNVIRVEKQGHVSCVR